MSETGDKQSDRFTPDEVIAKQRNRQLFVLSGIIIVLAVLVLITRQFKDDESPLKDVLLAGGMAATLRPRGPRVTLTASASVFKPT